MIKRTKNKAYINNNVKIVICVLVISIFMVCSKSYAQNENLQNIKYSIIAEGTDSPISDNQIVCYNKYFNKDYLTAEFLEKYALNDKGLYKKKMLIELFHSDYDRKGIDQIEMVSLSSDDKTLILKYNLINSNKDNDNEVLAPFLIIQVPKSKKPIKFILNGIEKGKTSKVYID
jgi:hypothetical protein